MIQFVTSIENTVLHDLQNPADRREIICDESLKTIFGNRDKVGMLEITKLIGPHFIKK
jgi:upstream activation factor subunit UAF30